MYRGRDNIVVVCASNQIPGGAITVDDWSTSTVQSVTPWTFASRSRYGWQTDRQPSSSSVEF